MDAIFSHFLRNYILVRLRRLYLTIFLAPCLLVFVITVLFENSKSKYKYPSVCLDLPSQSPPVEVHKVKGMRNKSWNFDYKAIRQPKLEESQLVAKRVFFCVTSSPNNFEKRQSVRDTWATTEEFKVIFFLGWNDVYEDSIKEESRKYNDIVQYNFNDTYRNLTLKSVSLITWARNNVWGKRQCVVKTDDDTFVNNQLLLKNLDKFNQTAIYGYPWMGSTPIRTTASKWFLSKEEFPLNQYPVYLSGSFYLVPESAVELLFQYILTPKHIPIEDVYITGIVAELAKLPRIDIPSHTEVRAFLPGRAIDSRNIISKHYVIPKEMRKLWRLVQDHS